MIRHLCRPLALIAGMTLGLSTLPPMAQAGITIDASVGGAPTGVNYANFDNLALGNAGGVSNGITVSFTGNGQAVQGSQSGVYAAPYLSNNNGTLFGDPNNGPDSTTYLSTGTSTVSLQFAEPMRYIGLLWGSVDNYNTLDLYSSGTLIASITGADVTANANGNRGMLGTFYVNINSTDSFDKVVARSSSYAFEFDNVAFNKSAVPEPSSVTMLGIAAIGVLGMARRKVKAKSKGNSSR